MASDFRIETVGKDLIVMGDDWWDKDFKGVCETVFLPYTKGISTSQIIKRIKNEDDKSDV